MEVHVVQPGVGDDDLALAPQPEPRHAEPRRPAELDLAPAGPFLDLEAAPQLALGVAVEEPVAADLGEEQVFALAVDPRVGAADRLAGLDAAVLRVADRVAGEAVARHPRVGVRPREVRQPLPAAGVAGGRGLVGDRVEERVAAVGDEQPPVAARHRLEEVVARAPRRPGEGRPHRLAADLDPRDVGGPALGILDRDRHRRRPQLDRGPALPGRRRVDRQEHRHVVAVGVEAGAAGVGVGVRSGREVRVADLDVARARAREGRAVEEGRIDRQPAAVAGLGLLGHVAPEHLRPRGVEPAPVGVARADHAYPPVVGVPPRADVAGDRAPAAGGDDLGRQRGRLGKRLRHRGRRQPEGTREDQDGSAAKEVHRRIEMIPPVIRGRPGDAPSGC